MSDPFVAEIRIFAGTFAPRGWAFCNGQLIAISQNTALFSLLGTNYGGDGKTTFGLPDLRGRAAIHQGNGAGLSQYVLGETGGNATVTLLQSEMPMHNHTPGCNTAVAADQTNPVGNVWAGLPLRPPPPPIYSANNPQTQMSTQAIGITGGNQPHNNMQPYLCLNYIIALVGVFPQRN